MAINFDHDNSHILLTGSDSITLLVQDLINAIRTDEATSEGMHHGQIAQSSGKDDLGGGVLTAITVELISPWQIKHEAGSYQATVTGGNLVGGISGNPVAFTAGVQVKLNQSANGVVVATGSGLSTDQSTQLVELWRRLNLDTGNDITHGADGSISGGGISISVTDSGTDKITHRS